MSITHTVLFQFKAGTNAEQISEACSHFLTLKQKCVQPETQSAYILSLKGGKDMSIEGMQNGITHGFVAEFASAADRDYYVQKDPAHKAFVEGLLPLLEKAIVVDFSDGVW
ncbi:hypothetical protein B0I35DRAFT_172005 [Stachybotrys elegans]|uniref:Stress-response A/B barrel domain-containing protein n=1 Tax=Stachybotrys elegans TaxID=80388 RepID=A0A8K0T1I9_9HYPO|nr:hypothetical protein B0I35DRAFT_172005 [Stachybotrys elegans]